MDETARNADLILPNGAGAIEIKGLASDSRSVGPGHLFAALPGTVTDGARFAGEAVAKGAEMTKEAA